MFPWFANAAAKKQKSHKNTIAMQRNAATSEGKTQMSTREDGRRGPGRTPVQERQPHGGWHSASRRLPPAAPWTGPRICVMSHPEFLDLLPFHVLSRTHKHRPGTQGATWLVKRGGDADRRIGTAAFSPLAAMPKPGWPQLETGPPHTKPVRPAAVQDLGKLLAVLHAGLGLLAGVFRCEGSFFPVVGLFLVRDPPGTSRRVY